MTFLTTEGYLVRWFNLNHGDRWFTFFTREYGLLKVIVGHRKLAQIPPLDYPVPLDSGELVAVPRRNNPGARLVDYRLRERHLWLAADPEVLGHALLFLESLTELSAEEDPQPEAYRLLEELLAALRAGIPAAAATLAALVKLFGLLGYRLDLEQCRRCRKPPGKKNLFAPAEGGFLHLECGVAASGLEVSPGTLRFLTSLAGHSLGEARRLRGDRRVTRESAELVKSYLRHLCQKRLGSEEFLEKMAAAALKTGPGTSRKGRTRPQP